MIANQELIGKIKDYFDLNIYETKVWLALLSKGTASAGEIATSSGVPRSRTYDVLESLEKKGFAIVKIGKPVKYLGVKPKIIIEKLKNNIRVNAEEKVSSLALLKDTDEFRKLEELYNTGISPVKREELSVSIKGRSLIQNHISEIVNSANKEVAICMSAEELTLKEKIYEAMFLDLKTKGVTVKLALYGEKKNIEKLKEVFDLEIKTVNTKAKFFIVDEAEVLFYLNQESKKDDHAIWINSEFFSKGFADLFEMATN